MEPYALTSADLRARGGGGSVGGERVARRVVLKR
jgi:hypothetical protein